MNPQGLQKERSREREADMGGEGREVPTQRKFSATDNIHHFQCNMKHGNNIHLDILYMYTCMHACMFAVYIALTVPHV